MLSDSNVKIDTLVEVTNFFSGGERRRAEILAQPECNCGSGQCSGCEKDNIKNCNNRDDQKGDPKDST
jgi:hypothetical protein